MFLLSALLGARSAAAAPPLTADEAVRQVLSRPEVQARLTARLATANAETDAATTYPTPRLSVGVDRVFGDINVGYLELSGAVEQSFDLSGWRSSLQNSLPHRQDALRAEDARALANLASEVRTAFYQVRYRETRQAALDAWIQQLQEGLQTLRVRESRGDASTFQIRRAAREVEIARLRRAAEASALAAARAELAGWLATPGALPALEGPLRPSPRAPADAVTSPEVARLDALQRALEKTSDAYGSPMWRGWSVGLGYRYAEVGPSTGHGLLASLSAPLALWNNDAPELARLRAQRARLQAERQLGAALVERRVTAAAARLEAALASLPSADDGETDVTQLARVAFGAGEATLTELLDAFESELDLRLSMIELEWTARRAAIELDRQLGQGTPR